MNPYGHDTALGQSTLLKMKKTVATLYSFLAFYLRRIKYVETARASLLNSKGCLDPCTQPLMAAFSAAPNPVSAGQTVVFTNNSSGATNFSWLENGLEFSQNQNPTQVFNTVGNYQITLKVTNSDPNCEDITQLAVEVQCPTTFLQIRGIIL